MGSFDDAEAVERAVALVNEQNSDLIFFTACSLRLFSFIFFHRPLAALARDTETQSFSIYNFPGDAGKL